MEQTVLSKNLSRIMDEQGKSRTELSFDSRIAYPNVAAILTGKTVDPRVSTLMALAAALDVTLNDLVVDHDANSIKQSA